jgi:hypothetical protein
MARSFSINLNKIFNTSGSGLLPSGALSSLFGALYSLPQKSPKKKGKSPLVFTGKAYIFVGSDIHPKILSIKNLSWTNYLEKPYFF